VTVNIEKILPSQPFFTPSEAAEILRVSRRTVISWLKNDDHPLVGVKLGNTLWRIQREDFIKYLEVRYGK
jgi:excisionase family DNA binding protein